MNQCHLLILGCLCGMVACASFTWDFTNKERKRDMTGRLAYSSTPDGTIHVFWERSNENDIEGFEHKVITPNGTIVKKPYMDISDIAVFVYSLATEVSNDGKYVFLVFDAGLLDLKGESKNGRDDGQLKLMYMESTDGGTSWSEPEFVVGKSGDYIARYAPSVYMERDTGRLYVLYAKVIDEKSKKEGVALAIREPGKTKFENEIDLPSLDSVEWDYIGQSIEKNKKYLHAFARGKSGQVMYSHSTDNGKKWSKFKEIAYGRSNKNMIQVAMNDHAVEGRIYLQYDDSYESYIVWSDDHGTKFQGPVKVGASDRTTEMIAVCGTGKKGILLSAHLHDSYEKSFIKAAIVPAKTINLKDLPYPFQRRIHQQLIHCRHVESDTYHVTYLGADNNFDLAYVARGTLKSD